MPDQVYNSDQREWVKVLLFTLECALGVYSFIKIPYQTRVVELKANDPDAISVEITLYLHLTKQDDRSTLIWLHKVVYNYIVT